MKHLFITIGLLFAVHGKYLPVYSHGDSMKPTLPRDSIAILDKGADIERGDIIGFTEPIKDGVKAIKRVIAVEGDSVKVEDGKTYVKKGGGEWELIASEDPKKFPSYAWFNKEMKEIRIKKGEVFVLGDNYIFAEDSRYYGPVPTDNITGEIVGAFSFADFEYLSMEDSHI